MSETVHYNNHKESVNRTGQNQTDQTKMLLALKSVAEDLSKLNQGFLSYFPETHPKSRAVLEHSFSSGGKRIRPAMFFMACNLCQYEGKYRQDMAAVCEFVHTASLLHDDVVDNSTLRRNKPTCNSIWGDQAAVLVGDLVYSRASQMMAETGDQRIVKTFAHAIEQMSQAELLQLEHAFNSEISEEEHLKIVSGKTAALISAACQTAGYLALKSDEEVKSLRDFGFNLGLGFQLLDDVLDYSGSTERFGKPKFADLEEGRVTLPLILALQNLPETKRNLCKKLLRSDPLSAEDKDTIYEFIRETNSIQETLERARKYSNLAIKALSQAFDHSTARDQLIGLAQELASRTQ